MPQLRATVDTFCCSQSSRSLLSIRATRARGCLPPENCSTPATATGKRGPAISDSSSSRSRIVPPCTSPAKQSVMWKFSTGTQRASGTPDCRAVSSSETSSGMGRAMKRRGIVVVEVLGHERKHVLYHDLDAFGIGMHAVSLVQGRVLRHAVEDERIEWNLVFVGQPLVEPVEGR